MSILRFGGAQPSDTETSICVGDFEPIGAGSGSGFLPELGLLSVTRSPV